MKFDLRVSPNIVPDVPESDDVIVGSCNCGVRWTGGAICHCASCHLTFTAVGGFDVHRVNGKCRTESELRDKGYEPNENGHWRKPMKELPQGW